MNWSLWKKKSALFIAFALPEGNFCSVCALSQCIKYWINLQNIYTSTIYINIYEIVLEFL